MRAMLDSGAANILREQQHVMQPSYWGIKCSMVHLHKPAERLGKTPLRPQIHATLQQNVRSPQMTADVTSTVNDFVKCAKHCVLYHRKASTLKLSLAFELLESAAIDILGPPIKRRLGFQYIIAIADQFIKLVQMWPLRWIYSKNVAQAYLKYCL